MDPTLMKSNTVPPRMTVLMPVYNGARYLREAVDSILAQSLSDFEFLIIDDGSTDASADIIRSYADPRITLVENGENLGLVATLNRGLALAKGDYVARMDCDDISLPRRLERQIAFMDAHPEIGICGTWVKTLGDSENRTIRFPTDPDKIRCITFFNSCVSHPSIVMRMSALKKHGISYDPAYSSAEDYALWAEALKHFEIANLGEVLLIYRQHAEQVTVRHAEASTEAVHNVRRMLLFELGIEACEEEYVLHSWLAAPTLSKARTRTQDECRVLMGVIEGWFEKLKAGNDKVHVYPQPAFSRMLFEQWFIICIQVLLAKGPRLIERFRLLPCLARLGLRQCMLPKYLVDILLGRCLS
jgi:hypothetical protein